MCLDLAWVGVDMFVNSRESQVEDGVENNGRVQVASVNVVKLSPG